MKQISSWGRLQLPWHNVYPLKDRRSIVNSLKSQQPGLAYGMGRSYGDVCLNPEGNLWLTTALNRFISFDTETGLLGCEAGILLRDIQRLMIPRGWSLPVTPGTQFITVGGAIANDVHGKNHHRQGTFGEHVKRLRLVRTNGKMADCSPEHHSDWLAATIGGLGLTGVITEVTLQLQPVKSAWLDVETIPYSNLTEFFQLADESEAEWEHTVAWVDCAANAPERGIFMRANGIAEPEVLPLRKKLPTLAVPFTLPISLMNTLSVRAFNAAYYRQQQKKAGKQIMHYTHFLYPLDTVQQWNRLYGPKGFYQYQMVVPRENGQEVIQTLLQAIKHTGQGSCLAVLKTFADRPAAGMLSFVQKGVTLALDFPERGQYTRNLFDELDTIVKNAGGRLYPAKDARMSRELFKQGYPNLTKFLPYRDPGISSGLSRRLLGV